jgi:hypothetical protein
VVPDAFRIRIVGMPVVVVDILHGQEKVSMTQDVWMSRKAGTTNAARALESYGPLHVDSGSGST